MIRATQFRSLVFVLSTILTTVDVTVVHVEQNGDPRVVSLLSKLLFERSASRVNSSKSTDGFIKNVKIEIDFVQENIPSDIRSLPWLSDIIKDREKKEELDRKKRSVSGNRGGVAQLIPAEYIVVVKLGIPVNSLNQSGLFQLQSQFAAQLHLPIDHVKIDKIRYHGNDIEMFFVRSVGNPLDFVLEDLIPAELVVKPNIVDQIKKNVPVLNITSIYRQQEVVFTSYPVPFWSQVSFRYVMAACGAVVLLLTASLIYCCCKKKEKTLKETDDEIRASQTIFYPTVKPDTKNPLMIQPDNESVFIPTGCIKPIPAQPIRAFKAKGLLERRGSSASLKIKLGPTPPGITRWDGVAPPKECTGTEYLLTAGNRLSRQDLRKAVKNPRILHQEFWEIPMNHPDKISVAGSGMKNRYRTIIPNEHSRVILPNSELDPLSSYINANYIRGYEGEKHAYIATQGPLAQTIVDFWHMVWHQKSPVIVMITKLKEKSKTKCENYLPEDYSSYTFGDIEVKVEKSVSRNGYTIRNLVLKCNGECQYILHYWYTAWPDHKPPESPTTILELSKEVEMRRFTENYIHCRGPVIVHCSAGIGRTGCFIAISVGMRQLHEEHSVDVLGIVCSMRMESIANSVDQDERAPVELLQELSHLGLHVCKKLIYACPAHKGGGMIQTHEQYNFVHQALAQYEKELEAEPPGTNIPER